MKWLVFDSAEQMVNALAASIRHRLNRSLEEQGTASWVVSGGSTPEPLFHAMQQADLDWSRIDIALVDERWVEQIHPRSNERFIHQHLLQGSVESANFVGMKTSAVSPVEAQAQVNQRYQALPQPFDSVLLGMGMDGHTASLFPNAEGLEQAMDPDQKNLCMGVIAEPSAITGEEILRMTLTASAICAARQVVLMIRGEAKRQRLEQALELQEPLPVVELIQRTPIDIYWAP